MENQNKILYENFINSIKCDVPDHIMQVVEQIFHSLSEGKGSIPILNLRSRLIAEVRYG